jgi:hypothetical protein
MQRLRAGLFVDAFGLSPMATAATKVVPEKTLLWIASHLPKSAYSDLMLGAPLIGYIAVRDRSDQMQCLEAGRTCQHVHLLATARGIAGRPGTKAWKSWTTTGRWGSRPPVPLNLAKSPAIPHDSQPSFFAWAIPRCQQTPVHAVPLKTSSFEEPESTYRLNKPYSRHIWQMSRGQ